MSASSDILISSAGLGRARNSPNRAFIPPPEALPRLPVACSVADQVGAQLLVALADRRVGWESMENVDRAPKRKRAALWLVLLPECGIYDFFRWG